MTYFRHIFDIFSWIQIGKDIRRYKTEEDTNEDVGGIIDFTYSFLKNTDMKYKLGYIYPAFLRKICA